ncbi:RelA/SpoT family protein [Chloroflexus sp.]|uniref:RelA/SpoT family protein n=1 Tax=Chloroflexus sp. TaxID=1904827 RepID=UPI002626D99B|nr:bifunctional (p)ppGpp synthetase/guanosine-3',5'-bis(diphosphate) 3'-pyrophosphohydrolase [uncultured Chloroflexus sp.]
MDDATITSSLELVLETPDGAAMNESLPPLAAELLKHKVMLTIVEQQQRRGCQATLETVQGAFVQAYHSPSVEALIARHREYLPNADFDLIRRSYALAAVAHEGQRRQSGQPYLDHPIEVALILLDLRLDTESIAAALLHDVVEDTGVPCEVIERFFGKQVANLVDGVTKLSGYENKSKEEVQAGTYRKLIIASADDPRVVLIKLADRLHNMRTIYATPPQKQQRVARETLDIYAPLAHRLGMWQMKSELEDLAFKTLHPDRYKEIAQGLAMRKEARDRIVQRVIAQLKEALAREGVKAEVTGRSKHIYSIWRKMERKGVPLERIYDQLAVRIIVEDTTNEVGACYQAMGVVHSKMNWTPVMSEFDDYIAAPKESSYRSIHTTVILPEGLHCEVQIRSRKMHEEAEHGIAAHWRYKEGFNNRSDKDYENKIRWLRELISWRNETTDSEFVDMLRAEFEERVFVFTPKGKIIDLPEGSTPIDFAYRIHSEVGHNCIGAKVNDRIVPLDYQLRNGEIVEILTAKSPRGPSRDWLRIVKTPSAKNHIKRYFRRLEREENINAGREMLEKELKRFGLTHVSFEKLVELAGPSVRSVDDLFYQIGVDDLNERALIQKLLSSQEPPAPEPLPASSQSQPLARVSANGEIFLENTGRIPSRLARCCNPIFGEPIVGFTTRGRGVTVHRTDCRTIQNLSESEKGRLMPVCWGSNNGSNQQFPVPLRIEAWDRVGLWRDISHVIAEAGINITDVHQSKKSRADGRTALNVTVSLNSMTQLSPLIEKINRIPDVIDVYRRT